jgi:hypothetical protein
MSNDVTFVFGTGNVAVQPGIYAFRIYVTDIPNECGTLMKKI